ncbi:MAG: tetratricopeptide repeat protein [bacterium]|nr:tetratricopeptide repeat protein [bacterium]
MKICPVFLILLLLSGCATGMSEEEAAGLYYNLGNAYTELEKGAAAVLAFETAWRLDPSLFQAGYNLARLHIESGRYNEGRILLEDLLIQDMENGLLLEALAWSFFLEGDEERALEEYQKLLELQYHHPRALYNSSRIYMKREEWQDAGDLLYILWKEKAVEPGLPEINDILFEWCQLQLKLGFRDAALESLLYLESEVPAPEISLLLGDIYSEEEQFGLALDAYNKALLAEDPAGETFFKKARILLNVVEDEEEGLSSLKEALSAGFDNRELINTLIELPDFLFTEQVLALCTELDFKLDDESPEEEAEEDAASIE